MERVKSEKKWPYEIWLGVYDLYEQEMIKSTTGGDRGDNKFEGFRETLKKSFVDDTKPYVSCGESFPKDKHPDIKYRSQQDRRVEILFFDKNEIPVLDCPTRISSVHKAEECPLRKGERFCFEYIDSGRYFTAVYHLKFEYYDRIKKKRVAVPEGLKILSWKEGGIELKSSSKYMDGIYEVTVEGITNSPREDDIYFTFETGERLYLYTEAENSDPVIIKDSELKNMLLEEKEPLSEDKQDRAPTVFEELPLIRRRHYYDLPEKWDSRNWYCRRGSFEGKYEEAAVSETNIKEPLTFSFDDIVLVKEDFTPVTWKPEYRFTMFSAEFNINFPDIDRPYFTNNTSDRNCLTSIIAGEDVRAVALHGRFYDVTTYRVKKGEILGARAGVLNMGEVHLWERRREPVVSGAGHYDIHYFSECIDSKGEECSVLLVYWCAHLKIGVGNVTETDLDNFRREGFIGSKKRWESKRYFFEPEKDPKSRGIKVIPKFFFEENLQVSKPHCIVNIHDPSDPNYRSSMGLDSSDLSKDTFKEEPKSGSTMEDNYNYAWYTMAHELGHASGFDDEYLESIEKDNKWNPVLPKFNQWYDGMPYSCDEVSMMMINMCPRLRYFWIQCRWLNENSKVKRLTEDTVFRVRHEGFHKSRQHIFKYYLPSAAADFYKAACYDNNQKNGSYGKFDLFLYQLGQDETTNGFYVKLITNQSDFDGILVVRVKNIWSFKNYTGNNDNDWMSDEDKLNIMRGFQKEIKELFNKRFWLLKKIQGNKLNKIYIYFLPHYQFEGNSSSEHFHVTVRADDSVSGNPFSEVFSGNRITIGTLTNSIMVFRYMLGLPIHTDRGDEITNISLSELSFLSKWVEGKSGFDYVLHG